MTGETSFKSEVATTFGFLQWSQDAIMGDWCNYFTGNLAIERCHRPAINVLADTVLLLAELNWVVMSQGRNLTGDGYCYMATRTGRGRVPKAIHSGEVSATDFRALDLIVKRSPDMSARRAVRYGLGVPEHIANNILTGLQQRDFVTKETVGVSWELSPHGRKMMA